LDEFSLDRFSSVMLADLDELFDMPPEFVNLALELVSAALSPFDALSLDPAATLGHHTAEPPH
jgi:hypothetical protein